MRKQLTKIALTAGIALATASTLSCSSDDGDDTPSSSSDAGISSPGGNDGSSSSGVGSNSGTSGEFTDSRDSETYKWVEIGEQVWMAENLNYNANGSKCYDEESSKCATYGRLYNWATAMAGSASSSANPSGVRGVCPSGWHLPSNAEWDALMTAVGGSSTAGTKLKAASGWNTSGAYIASTDNYGFSALPGGSGYPSGVTFRDVGNGGFWWSATEGDASAAWTTYTYSGNASVDRSKLIKTYLYSVRCVKDLSSGNPVGSSIACKISDAAGNVCMEIPSNNVEGDKAECVSRFGGEALDSCPSGYTSTCGTTKKTYVYFDIPENRTCDDYSF